MYTNKNNFRAFLPIGLILAIVGLVVGVGGLVGAAIVFPNWKTSAEITVEFTKSSTEKLTSYYAINNDTLRVYQTNGNSKCVYTIYCQARTQGSYTMVVRNLSFSANNTWNEDNEYSLASHWWNDIRFKVNKSAGTDTASSIVLNVGQAE